MIRCRIPNGSSVWGAVQMEAATTITATALFVGLIESFQSTSTSQDAPQHRRPYSTAFSSCRRRSRGRKSQGCGTADDHRIVIQYNIDELSRRINEPPASGCASATLALSLGVQRVLVRSQSDLTSIEVRNIGHTFTSSSISRYFTKTAAVFHEGKRCFFQYACIDRLTLAIGL